MDRQLTVPRRSWEDMDEREVQRVVRSAAESVYGVVAVVGAGFLDRLTWRLNIGHSGVAVVTDPRLSVTVDIRIADGVPRTQVATNVAEKVRYVIARDLGHQIAELTVRVEGRPVDLDKSGTYAASPDSRNT